MQIYYVIANATYVTSPAVTSSGGSSAGAAALRAGQH